MTRRWARCVVCDAPSPPRYGVCGRCWGRVPRGIREAIVAAYPRRVREHHVHQDVVAALLMWARDARAVRRG